MRKQIFIRSFGLFAIGIIVPAFLVISPSIAKPGAAQTATRPRLIVMLVIDQFRYDYLVRFRPQFVQGGFNLLLSGADFIDCRYDYATTATCPGHASLFTGAYPNMHGIIGNDWYDTAQGRSVYCVADPDTTLVGGSAGQGFSPRNLKGSTIGDELRFASGFESKVIAISLKDRASVVPGGHTANAAYWYDAGTGHFVTSTYYLHELPTWAAQFNQTPAAQAYCGKPWRALPETPGVGGKILKEFTASAGVPCPDPRFFSWLDNTPMMNKVELDFAAKAIEGEHLGHGPATDLLTISLSTNDYIGHAHGPYSPEVADATIRTDRYLAAFFKDLDRQVGLKNVWITLSADHGVAPNPYFIKTHNLGLGNGPTAAIKTAVEAALTQEFGPGPWVENMGEFGIYLNHAALKKAGANPGRAEFIAAEAAESVPGVRAAFTKSQLATGNLPLSPLARKASNSFYSARTGDVFLILDPFAVPVAGETGTTHGSPWNYDAQVPLILWGSAFRPGTYASPVQPIDLTPTIAAALELTQPSGAQGKPLVDALKDTQDRVGTH